MDRTTNLVPEKVEKTAQLFLVPARGATYPPRPASISISMPVITSQGDKVRISSKIHIDGKDTILWFEVDSAYRDYLATDTLDAFVTASLLPAILCGADIRPEGPMSSKLYHNLTNQAIPLLSYYLNKPRATRIIPSELRARYDRKGTGVLSGFSGGVDSFFQYDHHSGGKVPPEYIITHLSYNNVGSHGQHTEEIDRDIFTNRHQQLRKFAENEKKPFITVDSNLDKFVGLLFQQSFTVRNIAVAQLMQNVIGKYLCASSNTYAETKLEPSTSMSKIESVLIPMLCTERLECIFSGAQATRTNKTVEIANILSTRDYLDVCINPQDTAEGHTNCSRCCKCLDTMVTLDAAGKLKDYSRVFILERYEMLKNIYLIAILSSKASLAREVRKFMLTSNFPVPRSARIIGFLFPNFLSSRIAIDAIPLLVRREWLAKLVNRCLAW